MPISLFFLKIYTKLTCNKNVLWRPRHYLPGQANYAAANAGFDARAAAGQMRGRPTYSVQWGPWGVGVGGMAAARTEQGAATLRRLERLGVGALSPEQGLSALGALLDASSAASATKPTTSVSLFDWPRFFDAHQPPAHLRHGECATGRKRLLSEFEPSTIITTACSPPTETQRAHLAPHTSTSSQASSSFTAMDVASAERAVASAVATILGQDVARDEPLMAAGLDSLGVAELRGALATIAGVDIPATALFDYPSVAALAAFIASPPPLEPPTSSSPCTAASSNGGVSANGVHRGTSGGEWDDTVTSVASSSGRTVASGGGGGGANALLPRLGGASSSSEAFVVPPSRWSGGAS